jgi:N-acyl-D-amino-acid deacylase
VFCLVLAFAVAGIRAFPAATYDIIIKNTKIVDGTGRLGYIGDIAIKGERIVAIGNVAGKAAKVIDGTGLVTCPGFVDTHTHADNNILTHPGSENFIMQGITTAVSGNCGHGSAPAQGLTVAAFGEPGQGVGADKTQALSVAEWMTRVEKVVPGVNIAHLIPLTTNIRGIVMGEDFKRPATPAEIEKMKVMVEEGMKSGAWGMSSGHDPGLREFTSRDEIIECGKIVQKYGGIWEPHCRNHQNNWYAEPGAYGYGILSEPKGEIFVGRYHGYLWAVECARKANNLTLIFAHFTPGFTIPQPQPDWFIAANAKATLEEIIEPAWKRGQRVYLNMIACPYSVGWLQPMIMPLLGAARRSSRLDLPSWWKGLSKDHLLENLKSPEFRERVKNEIIYSGNFKFEMVHPVTDPYWMDCYRVINCNNKAAEGRTLGEMARERAPDDIMKAVYDESLNVMFDLLIEDPDTTWALISDKRELDASLPVFFKSGVGMPVTDCGVLPPQPAVYDHKKELPAQIAFGLFPYYIDSNVKQKKALTLEEAINRATYLPAQELLNMKDRGIIALNAYADLVVFNLETIGMAGDYEHPNVPPNGIEHVLINGKIAYGDHAITGVRAGKVLRKNAQ